MTTTTSNRFLYYYLKKRNSNPKQPSWASSPEDFEEILGPLPSSEYSTSNVFSVIINSLSEHLLDSGRSRFVIRSRDGQPMLGDLIIRTDAKMSSDSFSVAVFTTKTWWEALYRTEGADFIPWRDSQDLGFSTADIQLLSTDVYLNLKYDK